MSVLTKVRTAEERALRTQPLEQAPTRPPSKQSTWPLRPTQLPGAHLTWAEWVDWQASQLAGEPHGANLEASLTPH
jgi:hypothetical protein